jgi:molecular chaperone DnaK
MVEQNTLLGEFVLEGLPPLPRGQVRVRISFSLDADGILAVAAMDDKSGRETRVRIEAHAAGHASGEELRASRFTELSS